MCTVTYIPREGSFLLASNRDENRNRPPALPPSAHRVHGQRLLFPRDGLAGGTWIAVNASGYSMVLLNGAFEKHSAEPPYRLSRGLVLLEILTKAEPETAFNQIRLDNIEPFTLVMAGHGKLLVGRWDGKERTIEKPDPALPQIWSSVTLYPPGVRAKRSGWFAEWIKTHPSPDVPALNHFHQFTGDGDPENDLLMERTNGIFTNSISVLECAPDGVLFHHLDLRQGVQYRESLSFVTTPSSRR